MTIQYDEKECDGIRLDFVTYDLLKSVPFNYLYKNLYKNLVTIAVR